MSDDDVFAHLSFYIQKWTRTSVDVDVAHLVELLIAVLQHRSQHCRHYSVETDVKREPLTAQQGGLM